jgi:hypothetical protein
MMRSLFCVTAKGDGIIGRVGAALLLAMLIVCTTVSASSAATTPSWYPQLRLAVLDAGEAGAAISACVVPRAARPKAGHVCAVVGASDESGVLDRVSVYAETGAQVGPCKRLLLELDHTTTAAAARALAFATHTTTTMAKDVSGRRSLEQAAKHVTAEFAALKHCLGKS